MQIVSILEWVLSLNTLIVLYFTLRKKILGPAWGTIGQLLWFYYIYYTNKYGFAPGALAFMILNAWGWYNWSKDDKRNSSSNITHTSKV